MRSLIFSLSIISISPEVMFKIKFENTVIGQQQSSVNQLIDVNYTIDQFELIIIFDLLYSHLTRPY